MNEHNSAKMTALLLAVIIMTSALTACRKTKSNAEETGADSASSAVEKALSDDLFSYELSIDGHVYSLPCPVSEFEEHGWVIHDDNDSGNTDDTEPVFYAEDDYLRLSLNYGSGAAEYKYYDVSKGRVSALYTTVLSDRFTKDGVLVACLAHENDAVVVAVRDAFDEKAFYRTFKGEFPIKFSPSTQAEFISDNQLKITYLTGEDNKEITELFTIE